MRKLNWGLIGGGEGSQIGPAHRIGAQADGRFSFSAAALDADPDKGKAFATSLGVPSDRAYGTWREMLDGEAARADRIDLVTVATPNATHYEIAKAFLEAGFNVLCEKPMTMTVEEGEDIVRTAARVGKVCAVNYCYSGYAIVREMRAMVARGDLGALRLVVAEFSHGHHADAADLDNPRVRWRYDPKQAGASAQFADCGIHALHLACFVTGREVTRLSADFASCIAARELEDDGMLNFRMGGEGGEQEIVGRLWTSSVAIGRQHGLTLQVYGENGGLFWAQEQPNQARWQKLGGRTEIIEKGEAGLTHDAARLTRAVIGSPEGFLMAVANIYVDLAETIAAQKEGRSPDPAAAHYPKAVDGLRSMAAVHAAVGSAAERSAWVDARPPMFR